MDASKSPPSVDAGKSPPTVDASRPPPTVDASKPPPSLDASNSIAQAYVDSTLGLPPGAASNCKFDVAEDPFITVGSASVPQTNSGSSEITCTVQQTGDTFAVALFVSGGSSSVEIDGMIQNDPATLQAVTGTFSSMGGSYSGACTIDFSPTQTNGEFSGNSQMGVFPGRIWGILTCPMVTDQDTSNVCYGTAEFLFEFCGE